MDGSHVCVGSIRARPGSRGPASRLSREGHHLCASLATSRQPMCCWQGFAYVPKEDVTRILEHHYEQQLSEVWNSYTR